ncbi:PP2C family protein-serine/threonine phosphatase [Streptomyces graminofaciens]|nr:PP2C family protein-serine/threonine phosphatase [Streptomyces graminofaciens]
MRMPRLRREPDPVQWQQPLRVRGRSIAWVPPMVVLVAVPVIDYWTGGDFRIISWLVLVPGVAAAVCPIGTTAVYGGLAMIVYVLGDGAWPHQYRAGLPDFILVAVGAVLSVLACAVRMRGQERMLHMRDVVETTRRTLLRPMPPGWGGLDHAEIYLAADSEARVGGDFYDIQPGPHGTRVLLGDVQGKGLGAVEAAAGLIGTFREAAYHEAELAVVATRLEVRMRRLVAYDAALGRDGGERFATAVLVGFPPPETDSGFVEVIDFGHEPPLLVGAEGVHELPTLGGLPLGLAELVPRAPRAALVRVADDETLLLVTDGVTEARDGDGTFFPLRESLAGAPRVTEPEALVRLVRDGTLAHSGGHLDDDTTIFAVRRARPAR